MENLPHKVLVAIHDSGFINAFYFTALVFSILFTFMFFTDKNNKRIAYPFVLLSFAFLCYGLFNVFSQLNQEQSIATLYPEWFIKLTKYALPSATFITTYITIKLLSTKSFMVNNMLEKNKRFIEFIFIIAIILQVGLFFIPNNSDAMVFIIIMHIPILLSALFLLMRNYGKSSLLYLVRFLVVALLMLTFIQLWLHYTHKTYLYDAGFVVIHFMYGIALLVFSFVAVRFGYDEVERFFLIKDLDHRQLMGDLYAGIQKSQFFLVFQPKINLKQGCVASVEAYIRWEHPVHGTIFPEDFIPVAEKTNMINELCHWTIESAVKQAKSFINHDYFIPVAINFSVKNLNPETVVYLQNMLEKYQVPVTMVLIEITESLLIEPKEYQKKALKMLYKLGIKLSLDDYGTKFSSLRFISMLDLAEIKIDQSFVHDIKTNAEHKIIVASTIRMSQGLKLKAVAEGVENTETLALLKAFGCDIAQGNGIAKPMQAETLLKWLAMRKYKATSFAGSLQKP